MTGDEEGRRVVPAEEILGMIERGEPVEYENIIVKGDLDLGKLKYLLSVNLMGTNKCMKKLVTGHIQIKKSEVCGIVNFNYMIFNKHIDFSGTIFRRDTNFQNSEFAKNVDFRAAKFSKSTNFSYCQFKGSAHFGFTQFAKRVYFLDAKFLDNAYFSSAQFLNDALFRNATFSQDVFFFHAKFSKNASFNDCKFLKDADFEKAVFIKYSALFARTRFNQYAKFRYVNFKAGTYFSKAQFCGEADFFNAKFYRIAEFKYAKFFSRACFYGVQFMGTVDFQKSHFEYFLINKISSSLIERVYYILADSPYGSIQIDELRDSLGISQERMDVVLRDLDKDDRFELSDLYEAVKFSDHFQVDFWESHFFEDAKFEETVFSGNVDFVNSIFEGEVYFKNSRFYGDVRFPGSQFLKDIYFNNVIFYRDTVFEHTTIKEYAYFIESFFNGSILLNISKIYKIRFRDVNFGIKSIIYLKDSEFNRIYVNWNSIKKVLNFEVNGGAVYLALVKNFKTIEQFEDADNCYHQYREESRKSKRFYHKDVNGLSIDWSKFIDWSSKLSCGYGVRLKFPLAYITLSILIYILILFKAENWDSGRAIMEGILGWLLMPLFIVVLARKLIR